VKDTLFIDETNFDNVAVGYLSNKHITREMYNSSLVALMSSKTDITKFLSDRTNDYLLRLALNKLIIVSNEFGVEGSQRLMFYRCRDSMPHLVALKTMWTALNMLNEPLVITKDLTVDLHTVEIDIDMFVKLNNLTRVV
jgi:hypothetical protein